MESENLRNERDLRGHVRSREVKLLAHGCKASWVYNLDLLTSSPVILPCTHWVHLIPYMDNTILLHDSITLNKRKGSDERKGELGSTRC